MDQRQSVLVYIRTYVYGIHTYICMWYTYVHMYVVYICTYVCGIHTYIRMYVVQYRSDISIRQTGLVARIN